MRYLLALLISGLCLTQTDPARAVSDGSPLGEKAAYFEQDLVQKHSLDGLYVSIVPSAPVGVTLPHTVNEPGNVIHAGVWTGRYLAGVGYQYAVTRDPGVRAHGGQILKALRIQQEVTGKPGLLARGYLKGHGPVVDFERDGGDSKEWHQGQGPYADYRWYGDVSVDNFNAVLYGYAIYFDLAADDAQKKMIAHDVDRLMTHVLANHCRIIDVDGEPTQYGHIGIDPDPTRDSYYKKLYAAYRRGSSDKVPLRSSLMLPPDLLIAHRVTGKQEYLDFYKRVIDRFAANPEPTYYRQPRTPERLARTNHSSEGQAYEALFNLIRYEQDPALLKLYHPWLTDLWDANWTEGNSLFTYMTLALLPEKRTDQERARQAPPAGSVPHAADGLRLANQTLALYPIDRVLRPVMNSIRKDIEFNPIRDRGRQRQAAKPLPINERPLDNEDVWKGTPYQLDGWLKPTVTAIQFACDDPQVAWFCDSSGIAYLTLNHGRSWKNVSLGMMGAHVQNVAASKKRTFVLWAQTDRGTYLTRDGGLSWRVAAADDAPKFDKTNVRDWSQIGGGAAVRINDRNELVRSTDGGTTTRPAMKNWRIPRAHSLFRTPWGLIASGPGGTYRSDDGENWEELQLWRELETGAADFLHAYWMGRYYGFVPADRPAK